jgi:hypothetical protein
MLLIGDVPSTFRCQSVSIYLRHCNSRNRHEKEIEVNVVSQYLLEEPLEPA